MWADNEANLDLLGFDVLVDELVVALSTPHLLPLTVGVLGDWGSGKSSLLRLTRAELESGEASPYVCVDFSPWQYEDYDDVKVALLKAILDRCQSRTTALAAEQKLSRLRRFGQALRRPGRALGRTAILAAPAAIPLALSAIDPGAAADAVNAVQGFAQAGAPVAAAAFNGPGSSAGAPATDDIRDLDEFRRVFTELLDELEGVEAVVVFVDDLDRCLPETIVDTFEAIRLFLNSPRTAYVIGTSRHVVESAIDSRYPTLRREDGRGIGHDYLEKMLQLQISVPALSAAETETYVNLLITQLHLDREAFPGVVDQIRESRRSDPFAPALNAATLNQILGAQFTAPLAADLDWTGPISTILTTAFRGNPRQIKRFLNDLTWRRRAANRRGLDLAHDVLAKLMVLEEQSLDDLQTVFDWQLRSQGPAPEMARAHLLARSPAAADPPKKDEYKDQGTGAGAEPARRRPRSSTPPPAADVTSPGLPDLLGSGDALSPAASSDPVSVWSSRPRIQAWLGLDPDLSGIDLLPYFSYFRARLTVGSTAAALRPALQALIMRLTSAVMAQRRQALAECAALMEPDQDLLTDALLDLVTRRPDGEAISAAAELAGRLTRLGPRVCDSLGQIPHLTLPPLKVVSILTRLRGVEGFDLLRASWASSTVHGVAAAASKVPAK